MEMLLANRMGKRVLLYQNPSYEAGFTVDTSHVVEV
jgi:hypothetical protein